MVMAGDIGLFWLGIDDMFIMTAPAYHTFRIGLIVLAVGSILFAVTSARDSDLPSWGLCPSSSDRSAAWSPSPVTSAPSAPRCGSCSASGWAWLGLSLAVEGFSSFLQKRRSSTAAAKS